MEQIRDFLAPYPTAQSLLHGDLWSGNYLIAENGVLKGVGYDIKLEIRSRHLINGKTGAIHRDRAVMRNTVFLF